MTLCVTYATDFQRAVALSDSLLTTISKRQDTGSFLPSNQKITHQTPYGVKIHLISGSAAYSHYEIDILTAIAGNVSLGLQCTLHIESYLKYGLNRWLADFKFDLQSKVIDFWCDARDKQLQMSFTLFDHKKHVHIFECTADESGKLDFTEIEELNGFKISVLGDGRKKAKEEILSRISSLLYTHDLEEAIHIACVSALKNRIEDESERFIGGNMQGAVLNGYSGQYLVVNDGIKYFRAAELEYYEQLNLPTLELQEEKYPIRSNT